MSFERYKKQIYIIISAVGFAVCLFFSFRAAIVLLVVALIFLIIDFLSRNERRIQTLKLSDEIDRILHGEESFSFTDYEETEFSVLTAEIHKMTIKLREQNSVLEADRQFMKESLENISHQLRTPLTSILLITEMLRVPELSRHDRMEYLSELSGLLSRMNWLIDTLLGLSRIEAGAVKFKEEEISCRELIESACEPVSISMELKNVTVETSISGEPVFKGDRQYFTEALLNILKNCMEHTDDGGVIRIEAADNPIYTGIKITDGGKGFNEDELPHIFERFYRSGKNIKSGYGIGLAFAKRIVTAQNGSLTAENSKEGGAVFDMRIYHGTKD